MRYNIRQQRLEASRNKLEASRNKCKCGGKCKTDPNACECKETNKEASEARNWLFNNLKQ